MVPNANYSFKPTSILSQAQMQQQHSTPLSALARCCGGRAPAPGSRWCEGAGGSRAACGERPLPAGLAFSPVAPFCAAAFSWKISVFKKKTKENLTVIIFGFRLVIF